MASIVDRPMIFLLDYDRRQGKLVTITSFPDTARADASAARLELELRLHGQGIQHEVVILEAHDQAALRLTHLRYFEGVHAIAKSQLSD